jgi:hypothetical protein
MNAQEKDVFREAIEGYIAARQPPIWPLAIDKTPILFTNETLVPDLSCVPNNCLPLLLLRNWGLTLIGILTDTQVLMAERVYPEQCKVEDIYVYPDFKELFEQKLARFDLAEKYRTERYLIEAIYLIDGYQQNLYTLRWYYPKIASLLVDPPVVSPALRKYAQDNEPWPDI